MTLLTRSVRLYSFVARGTEYELHVQRVLRDTLGLQLSHSGGAGDGGIDLHGLWLVGDKQIAAMVQCKHSLRAPSPVWIRELEGVVSRGSAQLGILVATEPESSGCRQAITLSSLPLLFLQVPSHASLISRVCMGNALRQLLPSLHFRIHRSTLNPTTIHFSLNCS